MPFSFSMYNPNLGIRRCRKRMSAHEKIHRSKTRCKVYQEVLAKKTIGILGGMTKSLYIVPLWHL